MTTIVFCKDSVAADMQMTEGNTVVNTNYVKIFDTGRYIVGGAGPAGILSRVIEWVKSDFEHEGEPTVPFLHDKEHPEFEVVFIDKLDGKLFCVETPCFDVVEVEYPYAIGSGRDFARGYLLGKHLKNKGLAVKAVKAASRLDLYTGDRVMEIKVNLLDSPDDLEE
jgi:ATP-dependent protease HslVU (ClpYQ) peptidase subunit